MRVVLIFLGIILMFIGFFITTLGVILPSPNYYKTNEHEEKENSVKYSGVVMIGPIPIVFGNSPALIMISIMIVMLMIVWIFLFTMGIKTIKP